MKVPPVADFRIDTSAQSRLAGPPASGEGYVDQVLSAGRQRPSRHGAILGAALAQVADSQEPKHPDVPERCRTCAFRAGTIPNQMAGTLVEALRCVTGADPSVFGCHHSIGADGVPTKLCSGYVLARLAPQDDVREAVLRAYNNLQYDRGGKGAE